MRIFVTGASGWIGSATVAELVAAGHDVVGLARSDASAGVVSALGATVHRGALDDLDSLRAGAAGADGVVHLGYNHDFSAMPQTAATDRAAIDVLGSVLEGTGGPLVVAAGVLGVSTGRPATEADTPDPAAHPRIAGVAAALGFADRGVRAVAARFAPTVHGPGDHGFIAVLAGIAREQGVSAYVGDGTNRWSAVHRLDAAKVVALGVEKAPAGASLHAVAEEGVPTRAIAEAIGRGLGVPVVSIPVDEATAHFGWIGGFFAIDGSATSAATQELLGWRPSQPGLLEDLDSGLYTS